MVEAWWWMALMYLQEGTGVDVGARLALFLPVITRSLAMRERAVTIMKSKTRKFLKELENTQTSTDPETKLEIFFEFYCKLLFLFLSPSNVLREIAISLFPHHCFPHCTSHCFSHCFPPPPNLLLSSSLHVFIRHP